MRKLFLEISDAKNRNSWQLGFCYETLTLPIIDIKIF